MIQCNRVAGVRHFKFFIFIIFSLMLLLGSCTKNPSDFNLGEKYIESQTDIALIDSFSVTLSTVILDTVVTSGTASMLIGSYTDNTFGKITSHSYFQLGIPDAIDVTDDDVYDSLSLIIHYNGYVFGDTTLLQRITVHQLMETIDPGPDSTLTRNTTFNYDPNPIGSLVYTPRPKNTNDTLFIKINDDIGLDLFQKLIEGSSVFANNTTFINNYLNGLVLVADDTYEGSIVGFRGAESAAEFILYSSRDTEKIKHEFKLETYSKQFNHIVTDFSATQFNALINQRDELPSSNTDGLAFLQGCAGLAIRVDFPSLKEILLLERGILAKAELILSPLQNSYNTFNLPSSLTAYQTDKFNKVSGSVVSSTLTIDKMYHEETAYSFDLSEYLTSELADSYIDPEDGLIIMLNNYQSKLDRLILDEQNKHTKLKIYYLSY